MAAITLDSVSEGQTYLAHRVGYRATYTRARAALESRFETWEAPAAVEQYEVLVTLQEMFGLSFS
jgi:hypothetical protein